MDNKNELKKKLMECYKNLSDQYQNNVQDYDTIVINFMTDFINYLNLSNQKTKKNLLIGDMFLVFHIAELLNDGDNKIKQLFASMQRNFINEVESNEIIKNKISQLKDEKFKKEIEEQDFLPKSLNYFGYEITTREIFETLQHLLSSDGDVKPKVACALIMQAILISYVTGNIEKFFKCVNEFMTNNKEGFLSDLLHISSQNTKGNNQSKESIFDDLIDEIAKIKTYENHD